MSTCFNRIYYDRFKGKIHLWYTQDSKRYHDELEHEIEYFIENPKAKEYKDIFGTPVERKLAKTKKFVTKAKEMGKRVFNGDIPEEMKFLHKRFEGINLKPNLSDINVCYLDIEIKAEEKEFPKPEYAKYPINLITIKLSKNGKIYTFGTEDYKGKDNYWYIPDETEMLEQFIKFFNKAKVDIITGWNTKGFDIPYICKRCENLNINYNKLSPVDSVWYNENSKVYDIQAIAHLDYIELYKKFTFEKRDSYTLENIAQIELGKGKLEYEGDIWNFYNDDWNKFVDYNIRDVELVEELESKLKLIEMAVTLAHKSLIPIDKVFSTVAIIEGLLLTYLNQKKIVMEDRPEELLTQKLIGAYVESNVGYYQDVMSFDVESLYPHIMMIFNISPETLVYDNSIENDYINTPVTGLCYKKEKGIMTTVVEDGFKSRKLNKLKKKICESFDNNISDDDICTSLRLQPEYFNKLKKDIIDEGGNAKIYDVKQLVDKTIINSIYGSLASKYFHYYNIDNARVVTLSGQSIIKYLRDSINNLYNKKYGIKGQFQVIVDTDSCFITLEKIRTALKEDNISWLEWAKKHNKEVLEPYFKEVMDEYFVKYSAENRINFKLEKIGTSMLVTGDKHYAIEVLSNEGVDYKVPKIAVTGLDSKKSSSNKFIRAKRNGGFGYFDDIVKLILEKPDRKQILRIVAERKKEFFNASLDDICCSSGISDYNKYEVDDYNFLPKTPIYNQAAIAYNHMVRDYKLPLILVANGSKIRYIYIKKNDKGIQVIGWIGKCPSKILELYKVDYEKQFENYFLSPIQSIFNVFNWGKIDLNFIDNDDIFE